ncbi:MmgE/PrpD family protein [Oceanibaculum pacificum]|uniref:2-methylcitrate dehydratase n=1 Tax=Oceanibaculum pacificum TaxID=580166 RepID=A0A154VS83_9PROT|nr:MmgE/PrpD family protein [Oceanibaculum pacificum]KZD04125.1 hypothetical protein AUP43_03200 [Oceanibaculum pacificum]
MTATAALSAFVVTYPQVADGPARRLAREGIADAMAGLLSGWDDIAVRRVLAALSALYNGDVALVGRSVGLPAPEAALVNGTAAHALDFDDNYGPLAGHASAVLVPALLALGEARERTMRDLVDAYIVGLEAMRFVGDGVSRTQYRLGWHTTATVGVIGVAAACARLLRLGADSAHQAIALSTSLAAGSKKQFGTMAKPLHAGLAARGGVMAALLAEAGVTAAEEPLAGPWGYGALYTGQPGGIDFQASIDLLAAVRQGQAPLAIETHGLKLKLHPCCASSHAAIDLMLDLQREHGFSVGDVDSIEAIVREVSLRNLMYDAPTDPMQARFSMQYALAATLLGDGRLRLGDFTDAAVSRPEIAALMPRIAMRVHEPESPIAASTQAVEPAQMVIRLADGRVLAGTRFNQRGLLIEPLNAEDHAAKLRDCLAGTPFAARQADIAAGLADLDSPRPIRSFARLMAG